MATPSFDTHADFAGQRDAADRLAPFRELFELPAAPDGTPACYLCGHSLGLMPRAAREAVARELERWSLSGVAGHFDGGDGWFSYHERFAAPLAALVGAEPREVVAMNSLTVNLHLMLVSFFRPDRERRRILIERGAFPSDRYAVQSQLRWHGLDPERDLIELGGGMLGGESRGGSLLDPGTLDAALAAAGGSVALVLLPGVQYLSGEAVDLAGCAAAARRHGCAVGFDLAHAIGNLALDLRRADPDFAVWCSYKYLNGGPGAIGGCFVNRDRLGEAGLSRFEGWWGHDKTRRFEPADRFRAIDSAEAWQLSNPPVLAMAPLAASLEHFTAAGIDRLRAKSVELTEYLEALLETLCGERVEILTPRDPARRGAQLSVRVRARSAEVGNVLARLRREGVVVDLRAPDILRLAPVPLYNSFADVHSSATALARALDA